MINNNNNNKTTIITIHCNKSYGNMVFLSKYLIVLYSSFL